METKTLDGSRWTDHARRLTLLSTTRRENEKAYQVGNLRQESNHGKNKATTIQDTIGRKSQPKHPSISDDTSEASYFLRQRRLKAVTASETLK